MRRLLLLVPALVFVAACDDGSSTVVGVSPSVTVTGSAGPGPTPTATPPGGNPTPRSQLPIPTLP